MPTVGGHTFPYTKKGKAAAKKEAKKTGKAMDTKTKQGLTDPKPMSKQKKRGY